MSAHPSAGRRTVLLLYLLFASSLAASAATSPVRTFKQTAISPDATHVAWVEGLLDQSGDPTPNSAIYVLDLKSPNAAAKRIRAAKTDAREESIAWSPDGRRLAFLSDAEAPGQRQVFVTNLTDAAPRRLTKGTGAVSGTSWSPDGRSVAVLFTENAPRDAGPLAAMTPETGLVDQKVYEQRLAVIDVASGTVRQVSPADMYVHEYDWSPDGQRFVVTAAPGAGDANWYVSRLYTLAVDGGAWKEIYKPPLQMAVPRWSPDGKAVAFIGGLMSDEGVTGGDIFLVPATGGEARNVTPAIQASPSWLAWTDVNTIVFAETIDGDVGIGRVDVGSAQITQLWRAPETLSAGAFASISLSRDGSTIAAAEHSASKPPEVCAGPIGACRQVTHVNQGVTPSWGEMKSLHWTSDGARVQGWMAYPSNYDPQRRYPLIVVPHGGPASVAFSAWPTRHFTPEVLSARGYFVLAPNPRGSYGSGEAFTQANIKDFGYGDFRDILAGVDEAVKTLPIDSDRIGITGWSYGGYMTMWAVTQTNRFRAAVAGAGIVNFQSYYGQNDIDAWLLPYFGATVYDDPAVYARSSPITFITHVKTPTLVLVGERDGECPPPQSREFWHALKTLGVETALVIYPGEGHAILGRDHRNDIMERLATWFDDHLKAK